MERPVVYKKFKVERYETVAINRTVEIDNAPFEVLQIISLNTDDEFVEVCALLIRL